jgi:membrane protease YdiL (CAAX protease family)
MPDTQADAKQRIARGRFWNRVSLAAVAADLATFAVLHNLGIPLAAEYAARLAIVVAILLIARARDAEWREVVVGPSRSRRRETAVFVFFAAGCTLLAVAVVAITSIVITATGAAPLRIVAGDITEISMAWEYLLAAIALAPVHEELVYRGILLGPMRGERRPMFIVLFSGLIFALLHLAYGRPTESAPYYFAAGCIFGAAYLRAGHLWVPVALHLGGNVAVGLKDWLLLVHPEWLRWIPGFRFGSGLPI